MEGYNKHGGSDDSGDWTWAKQLAGWGNRRSGSSATGQGILFLQPFGRKSKGVQLRNRCVVLFLLNCTELWRNPTAADPRDRQQLNVFEATNIGSGFGFEQFVAMRPTSPSCKLLSCSKEPQLSTGKKKSLAAKKMYRMRTECKESRHESTDSLSE